MNRYEFYKPSDIDWVGDIPSHWETVQPKYKLNRITRPIDSEDEVITCFRDGVVTLRKNRREDGFTNSIQEHGYQQIHPGDLVVHEMDGFAGAIGISDSKGKSTPVYTVVEPDGRTDLKYIAYLLREMSQTGKIESLARSIRERTTDFRWKMWSVIHFPFPPIEEQKLISRYLDKKTSQIDSLIGKIQKKIELLKEQRTSLINHYVTRGLNTNVELKDSGVEWIGEIPKNWTLSKFGFVASLETGNTPSKSQEDLYFTKDKNGFLWVKPSDLDVGFQGVSDSEVKLTLEGKEQSRVVPKDSILVCCIGNTSGKFSIANCDLSTNQQINSITFENQILPRYGLYYMDVFGRDLLRWMNFVTLPIISKGDLSQQPIIVPPKSEQIKISEILDKIISEHRVVEELHLQKILLLKEYRQSLISSVVTGKVRVTEDIL